MDVLNVRQLLSVTFLLPAFTLFVGCGESKDSPSTPKEALKKPSEECQTQAIAKEYLVKWKNGQVTKHTGLTQQQLLENIIEPNLKKIEFAEPQFKLYASQPEDTAHLFRSTPNNWGAEAINAPEAWKNNYYGQDVVVAIVDDGVDVRHPQLKNQIFYNTNEIPDNGIDDDKNGFVDDYAGFNFAKMQGGNEVTTNHGTHIAGIIAAEHHDQSIQQGYVQGVAPGAKILPIDFIDQDAGATIYDAIQALNYAALRGAQIINASWGGGGCSQALRDTITDLGYRNILFVAAAGNSGVNIDFEFEYPASFNLSSMITVGSTGTLNGMAKHSNFGEHSVHIFAPGLEIISTVGTSYQSMTGTSMAAPFVSGAAALLRSKFPKVSVLEIKQMILDNSHKDPLYQNSSQGMLDLEFLNVK